MPRAEDQRIGVLPMAEKQEQADGKRASFGRNSSNFGFFKLRYKRIFKIQKIKI